MGAAIDLFASSGMTKINNYWLMKSEPDVYSWDDLVAEGEGTWDGVRNYTARNNMRAMVPGDQVFFYHSNIGVEIVGIAEITQSNIPDPTDDTGRWSAVKLKPVRKLRRPVTLNPEERSIIDWTTHKHHIPKQSMPLKGGRLSRAVDISQINGPQQDHTSKYCTKNKNMMYWH